MKYPLKYALQPVPEKNSGQTEFFSGTGYINFVSSKLKSDESDFCKKNFFLNLISSFMRDRCVIFFEFLHEVTAT